MNLKYVHYFIAFYFSLLSLTGCAPSTAPPAESDTPTAVILLSDLNGALLGSLSVEFGNSFILDGRNSSGANGSSIATYRWSALTSSGGGLTVGTPVETSTSSFTLNFPGPYLPPGEHAYQLQVVDTDGNTSQASQILINVIDNIAPTAILHATDPTGVILPSNTSSFGEDFILMATGSNDIGGSIVTYRWSALTSSGGGLTVGNPVETTSDNLTLTASTNSIPVGPQTYQLEAIDDSGNVSNPAQLQITIIDTTSPTALLNVTDSTGTPLSANTLGFGQSFILNGASSNDIGGNIVTYRWTALTSSGGGLTVGVPVETSNDSFTVNFTFNPGAYVYQLEVIDDSGNVSLPAQIQITIIDTTAPTAVLDVTDSTGAPLSANTLGFGQSFILNGASSNDSGGSIVTYRWTALTSSGGGLTVGAPVETSNDSFTVNFTFNPGAYVYQLEVIDDSGNVSLPAQIQITIIDTTAPTAVLDVTDSTGAPLSANTLGFGQSFILNGASSNDSGGSIVTYRWTALTSSGGGLTVGNPVETTSDNLTLTASTNSIPVGTQTYQLEVIDDSGNVSKPSILDVTVLSTTGDTTPPSVDTTGIADGSTDIHIDTTVSVTFSEAMDSNSISVASFTLLGASPVTGTVAYDAGSNTATFTPASKLTPGVIYTATLTTAVSDVSGNSLVSLVSWSFTTEQFIHRVSVQTGGVEDTGSNEYPAVNADGSYIAFESWATDLVPGDINSQRDIFIHDYLTKTTTRLSVAPDGTTGGDGASFRSSISGDGRYVVFESRATNLVAGDTNGSKDIFLRDRNTNTTSLISITSAGIQGNGLIGSNAASISADGNFVSFYSFATNLVSGDTNNSPDVFVRDRINNLTSRVSIASDGSQSSGTSDLSAINADGRFVAFKSSASNLVGNDNNGSSDIFVHDRTSGTTTRVSVSTGGTEGNNNSAFPAISADGRYIAFASAASSLIDTDTNNEADIFVHDRTLGTTTRVSVSSEGIEGNGESYNRVSISADGRYVTFESHATNLVANDNNIQLDTFIHDTQSGTTMRLNRTAGNIEGNDEANAAVISSDGRYACFSSAASNLVDGDSNLVKDIFRVTNTLP